MDERRRQLLERSAELFALHSYDELSMARIAREAGISKPLLYHYFPSKQALFEATLQQAAEEVARRTEPDPSLPPGDALVKSVDEFLAWVEENDVAYAKLIAGATGSPEVRDLIAEIRDRTSQRIVEALGAGGEPEVRTAVRGWLWFMDGAILDWLEHRDMSRPELHKLLLAVLGGALAAAGRPELPGA